MNMEKWFDGVQLIDYCVQDHMLYYCRACGETLDPARIFTGGDRFVSSHPQHCSMDRECVNRILLPNGQGMVGAALNTPLTEDGVKETQSQIAMHVLYGSERQILISRLWHHLYPDVHPKKLLAISTNRFPLRLADKFTHLLHLSSFISSVVMTDLRYVYCLSCSPSHTGIWRLTITSLGELRTPEEVEIPSSEFNERNHFDIMEEAVSSGAWD